MELTDQQLDEILKPDNDWYLFHDAVVNGVNLERELTYEECKSLFQKLPDRLKALALEWGCSDTVFRDGVYELFQSGEINLD